MISLNELEKITAILNAERDQAKQWLSRLTNGAFATPSIVAFNEYFIYCIVKYGYQNDAENSVTIVKFTIDRDTYDVTYEDFDEYSISQPLWIGLEFPYQDGTLTMCIGINQEDGHEVSLYNEVDYQLWKDDDQNIPSPWCLMSPNMVVTTGRDEIIFNDNHKLKS